jgi:hypothetical protein
MASVAWRAAAAWAAALAVGGFAVEGRGGLAPSDAASSGTAQVEVRPELEGRVLLGERPLGGVQVVLHHVSADSAGELDSVPSGADGAFRFRLPGVPDPGARGRVFFASVRHEGVLYFGPALSRPIQLDSLYVIRAFDTVTAPTVGAELEVAVRYLILEEGAESWQVTDLFEVVVDAGGTLVAQDGGVTWSHPLPDGARESDPFGAPDLEGGEQGGAQVLDGRAVVRAALSPGTRQFVVRYEVPSLDGLAIPFTAGAGEVELLVREPAPDLAMNGLEPIEAVEMEPGVVYRRYAGSFPANAVVSIEVADPPLQLPLEWLAVLLALLLSVAGVYAVRRGQGGGSSAAGATPVAAAGRAALGLAPPAPADDLDGPAQVRRLQMLEVAGLDEALESDSLPRDERARLEARRRELVARLRGRW